MNEEYNKVIEDMKSGIEKYGEKGMFVDTLFWGDVLQRLTAACKGQMDKLRDMIMSVGPIYRDADCSSDYYECPFCHKDVPELNVPNGRSDDEESAIAMSMIPHDDACVYKFFMEVENEGGGKEAGGADKQGSHEQGEG